MTESLSDQLVAQCSTYIIDMIDVQLPTIVHDLEQQLQFVMMDLLSSVRASVMGCA